MRSKIAGVVVIAFLLSGCGQWNTWPEGGSVEIVKNDGTKLLCKKLELWSDGKKVSSPITNLLCTHSDGAKTELPIKAIKEVRLAPSESLASKSPSQ